MNIYNVHTHLFNLKCAPAGFFGNRFARWVTKLLNSPILPLWLVKVLDAINPATNTDKYSKLANMVRIGSSKNQQEVFNKLLDETQDWPGMKMVVLSLDMDHMGAGLPVNNFTSQLWELFELKLKNPKRIVPFIGVDPRRDTTANLRKMVKEYIEKKGFGGIKLYPPLGFFPFHPNLYDVYAYAQDHQIPILTHCDTGGIYYQGPLQLNHRNPEGLDGKPAFEEPLREAPMQEFKHRFTDPTNFEKVFEAFPELKVCFAHYGGKQMIMRKAPKYIKTNWYKEIKKLIGEHPNAYTDISYTLHNTSNRKVMKALTGDIRDPNYANKILFGTDFYMTIREKGERRLINDFKNHLTFPEWQMISSINVNKYLNLNIKTNQNISSSTKKNKKMAVIEGDPVDYKVSNLEDNYKLTIKVGQGALTKTRYTNVDGETIEKQHITDVPIGKGSELVDQWITPSTTASNFNDNVGELRITYYINGTKVAKLTCDTNTDQDPLFVQEINFKDGVV